LIRNPLHFASRRAAPPWPLLNPRSTTMKLKSLLGLLALASAVVPAAPALASGLDGRSFQGVFLERGKTSGDADTIIFKDGRFRSTACDRYGYSDATYRMASAADGVTTFEAETQSAKYGKLKWTGVVRGKKLDA